MLTCLRVKNLAIIDELEVDFGPGLNVVTGETGAGKSILIAALGLVLGGRARPELIRTGAERATVEALFDVRQDAAARDRLRGLDGGEADEADGEIVIRRVIEAEGRSRATVNGRLATLTQLGQLAAGLVDISSQHEHHTLVNPATHLGYLDAYAGLDDEREQMEAAWARFRAADAEIEALRQGLREDRADLLRFQAQELEKAIVDPAEQAELEAEAGRLRHAERLGRTTAEAAATLYSGDRSVVGTIKRQLAAIDDAARLDPTLTPLVEQLRGACAEVEDAGRELSRYSRSVEEDPERLAAIDERLSDQKRLRRKYGDDLAAARDRVREELGRLDGAADRLVQLDEARERALADAKDLAARLSARRQAEAATLAGAITRELSSLGMGEARVEVAVAEGGMTGSGVDRVEFLIATNRGEAPRPLRKVASGGELSRALLAVKRVLARLGPVGLYVFDEVDSGVGGAIAEAIGEKIADVARHHQVLCITHLPQIAAFADRHYHVRKFPVGDRTRSEIVRLSPEQRVEELARMLGGREITDVTRQVARELLNRPAR